jgi:hypothetical protein
MRAALLVILFATVGCSSHPNTGPGSGGSGGSGAAGGGGSTGGGGADGGGGNAGGGGSTGGGGAGGGGGNAGGGGSTGGGGTDGGGTAGDGGMIGGPLPTSFDTYGSVNVAYVGPSQIIVHFGHVPSGMPPGTATVIGPCVLSNIPDGATRISPGTLTITDARGVETLPSNTQGNIPPASLSPPVGGARWLPGDDLTIDGAGSAAFGAFHASVTMPQQSAFLTRFDAGMSDVSRNADLTVKWSGGSGNIVASFWSEQDPSGRTLDCEFPAVDGQGIVPAAALLMLPAGAASIDFANNNSVSMNVGGAYLTLTADALQPAGNGSYLINLK